MSKKEQNQRHYQKHKAKIDARNQEWREANPKHFAFLMQRQHAKERGIEFLFELDEWIDWWGDDFDKRIVDFLAEDFKKNEGMDLRTDKQVSAVRSFCVCYEPKKKMPPS